MTKVPSLNYARVVAALQQAHLTTEAFLALL